MQLSKKVSKGWACPSTSAKWPALHQWLAYKAADLTKLDCQTVTEAASWCKKEIVAEQLQSECFGMCDELILWLFMKTVETVPKCYDKWAL